MARTAVRGAQIADGSNGVDLTVDVTGTLPVVNGGTGKATNSLNAVLLGNGTGALQEVAPGTSGNVLTSNGTTWSSTAASGGAIPAVIPGDTTYTVAADTQVPFGCAVPVLGTLVVNGVLTL